MRAFLTILALSVLAVPPAWAAEEMATSIMHGTIVAIDVPEHRIVLEGDDDQPVTLNIGPGLRDFDRVQIGDDVILEFREAAALKLEKVKGDVGTSATFAGSDQLGTKDRPAEVGRGVTVIGRIARIDREDHKLWLDSEHGPIGIKVGDPALQKQLDRLAVGDVIEAGYVEAVAMSIRNP